MPTLTWKVGELAKRTGVTVRTLHHYDQIGLLKPTGRTDSGHRLYSGSDLKRLQAIASLRYVGFSLDEIGQCLDGDGRLTLTQALNIQIERLEHRIEAERRLRARLAAIVDRLNSAETISVDELTETIERTWSMDKYYSADQLDYLARRAKEVGQDRIQQVQREWQELFQSFEDAMNRNVDPASEEVQALARKSADLIKEFTGGDSGVRASLGDMYRQEGGENITAGHGMQTAPGLWEYMARASATLG